MKLLTVIETVVRMVNWRHLRIMITYCPLCSCRRLVIRLDSNEIAVRCFVCRASAVTMSIVSVLRKVAPEIGSLDVYELSSRGPLFHYLKKNVKKVTSSEFFTDVALGEFRNGVQCQDVQRLSYPSASFDICTSTEVFEHVPDDSKGFSEILRVLRPNGIFIFTVPLHSDYKTIERALHTSNGEFQHLLPPEYHGDPLSETRSILAFRNYGQDITDRLRTAGFVKAEILMPEDKLPWGFARPVIVAYRGAAFNNQIPKNLQTSCKQSPDNFK